jgi:hypothetical protein
MWERGEQNMPGRTDRRFEQQPHRDLHDHPVHNYDQQLLLSIERLLKEILAELKNRR